MRGAAARSASACAGSRSFGFLFVDDGLSGRTRRRASGRPFRGLARRIGVPVEDGAGPLTGVGRGDEVLLEVGVVRSGGSP